MIIAANPLHRMADVGVQPVIRKISCPIKSFQQRSRLCFFFAVLCKVMQKRC